jgi:hypothetical protein
MRSLIRRLVAVGALSAGIAGFSITESTVAYAQTAPPAAQNPPASAPPPTAPAPRRAAGQGRGAMAACQSDIQAVCPGLPARGGQRFRCLRDNQAKLSPACADVVAARVKQQAERREVRRTDSQAGRASCRADGRKFCQGQRGRARVECLAANQSTLNPQCAAWVQTRMNQLQSRAQRSQPKQ